MRKNGCCCCCCSPFLGRFEGLQVAFDPVLWMFVLCFRVVKSILDCFSGRLLGKMVGS